MSARRELLTQLFRLLDERQVPYCVQRNYARLLDDPDSDVDLLTLPSTLESLFDCCLNAARTTGNRLVQKTRFVNHSLVFWNGAREFLRIDVDVEKRWKRIPLLTAEEILRARRRHENFYVPDRCHETVILLMQALWQGKLSERYRENLSRLQPEITDKNLLRKTLRDAFGCDEDFISELNNPALVSRMQRAVTRAAWTQPSRACQSLKYQLADFARLTDRIASPPGIFLCWIGGDESAANELIRELAVLFPVKKAWIGKRADKSAIRKALFKGGLAIQLVPATEKPAPLLRQISFRAERSFAAYEDEKGATHVMHFATGFMQSFGGAVGRGKIEGIAQFICTVLARQLANDNESRFGRFAVLVGLDGSGKTTLARNLANLAMNSASFAGLRYFHWRPKIFRQFEFPLPEFRNIERKPALKSNLLNAVASALRLLKNAVLANLAWHFRVRPLVKRGYLVLVDRYIFNYRLDPASVKFAGPEWLLNVLLKLFPQPELVVVLRAPAEILLARKQELSDEQIAQQAAMLDAMKFENARVVFADATQLASEVARATFAAIENPPSAK